MFPLGTAEELASPQVKPPLNERSVAKTREPYRGALGMLQGRDHIQERHAQAVNAFPADSAEGREEDDPGEASKNRRDRSDRLASSDGRRASGVSQVSSKRTPRFTVKPSRRHE
jgi:hypothetical protein